MGNASGQNRKEFRERHDCGNCLYFQRPRKCPAETVCPIETDLSHGMVRAAIGCPKDMEGGCPYGNSAGTCFGFCIKRILKEMRRAKEKRNEERRKEQEEAGYGSGD